ncbi:MAG: dihydrofolate reductase [Clostridiales bacterium]|nr:dihydrofolate reductase [Clostridiales bacterium]
MFNKLVAIEPVSLIPSAEKKLGDYAREVIMYPDIPSDDEEILRRIGDADAVLLSYTSRITRSVIERSPNVRYIGMCCSLYSEESANVDIACARERGIRVLGIRDYGDRGVVEYVLHELVGLLHGFGGKKMLRDEPAEITGLKVGIVGLGVSGKMIAEALQFMGAEVSYYSRSRKRDAELAGMAYKPLPLLLEKNEVIFTCLNKNVLLLQKPEFEALGNGKVLFNTSIGPGFDSAALNEWVRREGNYFFCDTKAAAGEVPADFFDLQNVYCPAVSAGRTKQAFVLLSQKVLANIETALKEIEG